MHETLPANMHETLQTNMHETLPAVYYNDSTIGFHFLHRSCLNRSYGKKLEGKTERILHVLQCVKINPKKCLLFVLLSAYTLES